MSVRKAVSFLLCILLLLLPLSGCGAEEVVSTTESGFTTRFNPNTGTLTVSGEGTLNGLYPVVRPDEYSLEPAEENHTIKKVILRKGITGLNNSFNGLMALEKISFPSSLKKITGSFMFCNSLEKLTIPKTVKIINEGGFNYCSNLSDIQFKGRIKLCHGSVFTGLDSLEEVTIPDNSVLCGAFRECDSLKKVMLGANLICHEAEPESQCGVNFVVYDPEMLKGRTYYIHKSNFERDAWSVIEENIDGIQPDNSVASVIKM